MMKLDHTQKKYSINCRGKLMDLSTPKIMGILNLTPDSFSDGGKFNNEKNALHQVEKMIGEGADFIDIGAQSTRPNAELVSEKVEIERLGKMISLIKKEFPEVFISLDTFYADVVQFGFEEGIDLVNDVSGGDFDEKMLKKVAEIGLPYILMHSNRNIETMHVKNDAIDITILINQYFSKKIAQIRDFGIKDIILDPGFGFGKSVAQNHQMLENLPAIYFERYPILVGISRKSFIYKPLGKSPTNIVEETKILHEKAVQNGAKILRVHDVGEAKNVVKNLFNI